jgi:hypothetical protein
MLLLFYLNTHKNETFNNNINNNNNTPKNNYICYKNETFNNNIPKNIYICYKTKIIPSYIIPNIKKIYPDYDVKFYDDNDCIDFLKTEYRKEYVDVFNSLKSGPIKADFWRICILYKYGGIYSDIDIEHIKNVNDVIDKDVTFVTSITCPTYKKRKLGILNPCFILSKPNHYILKHAIDVYLDYYKTNKKYSYYTYSITNILADIFKKEINITNDSKDGIYYDKYNNKYQLLLEIIPNINILFIYKIRSNKFAYVEYNKKKLFNVRYKNYKYGSSEWYD